MNWRLAAKIAVKGVIVVVVGLFLGPYVVGCAYSVIMVPFYRWRCGLDHPQEITHTLLEATQVEAEDYVRFLRGSPCPAPSSVAQPTRKLQHQGKPQRTLDPSDPNAEAG